MSSESDIQLINEMIKLPIAYNNNKNPQTRGTFITKLYDILSDQTHYEIISWSPDFKTFTIHDSLQFVTQVIPKYFKHSNFNSFTKQLAAYGFRKSIKGWTYTHEVLKYGDVKLFCTIQRNVLGNKIIREEFREKEQFKMNETEQEIQKLHAVNQHLIQTLGSYIKEHNVVKETLLSLIQDSIENKGIVDDLKKGIKRLLDIVDPNSEFEVQLEKKLQKI